MAKKKDLITMHLRLDKETIAASHAVQDLLRSLGQKTSHSAAVRFAILKTARDIARSVDSAVIG